MENNTEKSNLINEEEHKTQTDDESSKRSPKVSINIPKEAIQPADSEEEKLSSHIQTTNLEEKHEQKPEENGKSSSDEAAEEDVPEENIVPEVEDQDVPAETAAPEAPEEPSGVLKPHENEAEKIEAHSKHEEESEETTASEASHSHSGEDAKHVKLSIVTEVSFNDDFMVSLDNAETRQLFDGDTADFDVLIEELEGEGMEEESTRKTEDRPKSPEWSIGSHDTSVRKSFGMASTTDSDFDYVQSNVQIRQKSDIIIDRKMYSDLYLLMNKRLKLEKQKNNILHAKVSAYYMRRKMYYILKENLVILPEATAKYKKELDAFEFLFERSELEKSMLLEEVARITNQRDVGKVELEKRFQHLQDAQVEYVHGLNLERMGQLNFDKVVERMMHRQKNQMQMLIKMRLEFIKLRNNMHEKSKQFDELDNLGPGYRIMDFVQLKQDNRLLQDRLEERETETTKIRADCKNTLQILAHKREKVAQMDVNITQLKDEFEGINQEFFDAREQLGFLKRQRYMTRRATKKLKFDNGLLAYPKLLGDKEKAEIELVNLQERITKLEEDCQDRSDKIRAVRKNMELYILRKRIREQKNRQRAERKLLEAKLSQITSVTSTSSDHNTRLKATSSVKIIKSASADTYFSDNQRDVSLPGTDSENISANI